MAVEPSSSGEARPQRGSPPKLRIVTKFPDRGSFAERFAKFVVADGMFVVSKHPRAIGTRLPFSVELTTGAVMLEGEGEVVEVPKTPNLPADRSGMRLRFLDLTPDSRALVDEMVSRAPPQQRRKPATVPIMSRPLPPVAGRAPPATPGDAPVSKKTLLGMAALAPPSAPLHLPREGAQMPTKPGLVPPAPDGRRYAEKMPGELRTPGSPYVLPANPFMEMDDVALEGFIDCTLYEDTAGGADAKQDAENAPTNVDAPLPGEAARWLDGTGPQQTMSADASAPVPFGPPPAAGKQWPPGTGPGSQWNTLPTPPPPDAMVIPGTSIGFPPAPPAPPGSLVPEAAPSAPAPPRYASQVGPPLDPLLQRGKSAYDLPLSPPEDMTTRLPPREPGKRNLFPIILAGIAVVTVLVVIIAYGIFGGGDQKKGGASPSPTLAAGGSPSASPGASPSDSASPGASPSPSVAAGVSPSASPAVSPQPSASASPEPSASPTASVGDCEVEVRSKPRRSPVLINGEKVGKTPVKLPAACGQPFTVTIARSRYEPLEQTVTPEPGTTALIEPKLQRPVAKLRIVSTPPGALVKINGRKVGTTPTTENVKGFTRLKIELSLTGFKTALTKAYLKGKTGTVSTTLVPVDAKPTKPPSKPRRPKPDL